MMSFRMFRSLVSLALVGAFVVATAQKAVSLFPTAEDARSSGPGHFWQGGPDDVNPYSFAKQTSIPLIGWRARGGMPMIFTLHHNSMAFRSLQVLGPKWSHTHDVKLYLNKIKNQAAIRWGDHRLQIYTFESPNWVCQSGYRDTLTAFGGGFRLTLQDQTRLDFALESGGVVPKYRLSTMTDRNGNQIQYQYDGLNRLVRVNDPNNRSLHLEYVGDKLDKMSFEVGAFVRSWQFHYDGQGRLIKVDWPQVTTPTGPQTYSVLLTYGLNNNVATETDREGNLTSFFYNGNRITETQWPMNSMTQRVMYQYDSPTLHRITDPIGVTQTYEYDALSRLIRVQDPLGNNTGIQYTDPDYGWRPSSVTGPSGTNLMGDYNGDGLVVGYVSPWNQRWDLAYDSQNNLVLAQEPLVTNAFTGPEAGRHRTEYQYDSNGNLIQVRRYTSPTTFNTTLFAYDPFGNVISSTNPLNNVAQYQYDAYGNLVRTETPMHRVFRQLYTSADPTFGFTRPQGTIDGLGVQTSITRDEWGRKVLVSAGAGTDVASNYDGLSRLVRMQDPLGTTNWVYDANGRLGQQQRVGDYAVNTSFLPNGLRSSVMEMSNFGSRTIQYGYDSRNLLINISDGGPMTTFQYDAEGRLVQRMLGNGAKTLYNYANGLLVTKSHNDFANLQFFYDQYAYQENGLCRAATEIGGGVTQTGYDFLNRLTREERTVNNAYAFSWAYDPAGNRALQQAQGVVTNYSYDTDNLLVQAVPQGQGPDLYQYNMNGELTDRARQNNTDRFHFSYDLYGRMTSMTHWNGAIYEPYANYAYDGLSRRVERDRFVGGLPDTQNLYRFDGRTLMSERRIVQGVPTEISNLWAVGLIATHGAGGANPRWSATDAYGDMRASSNQAGSDTGFRQIFNRFGDVVSTVGTPGVYAFGADSGMRTEGDAGLTSWIGGWGFPFYDSKTGITGDGLELFFSSPKTGITGDGLDWFNSSLGARCSLTDFAIFSADLRSSLGARCSLTDFAIFSADLRSSLGAGWLSPATDSFNSQFDVWWDVAPRPSPPAVWSFFDVFVEVPLPGLRGSGRNTFASGGTFDSPLPVKPALIFAVEYLSDEYFKTGFEDITRF